MPACRRGERHNCRTAGHGDDGDECRRGVSPMSSQRRVMSWMGLWVCLVVSVVIPLAAFAQESPPAPAPPAIDSGDTAWVLTSTALVLLMTAPGLALFYGGLVRSKNVLGTIMQSFIILCLVSVIWVLWGYTLAFGPDKGGWIGGLQCLDL